MDKNPSARRGGWGRLRSDEVYIELDRRLLALAVGMFALGTDNFVIAGVLPEIARDFSIGIGSAGQMTTVYALSFALLSPTIAALTANVPRKPLLLSGLGTFVLANLGTALSPNFGLALASRALAGLGAAMFSPTAAAAATLIVPPERRGSALAIVVTGMTVSTAIGSPIGTVIGGLGDWRWTMIFVASLAFISVLGLAVFLRVVPVLSPISLQQRLAPLADKQVALALASAFLFFGGSLTIYTYFAVIFAEVIKGRAVVHAVLLVIWGLAGLLSNIAAGRMCDELGNHKVLTWMLVSVLADFALLQLTRSSASTAIGAITVWGACSWGALVPMQHRLVHINPSIAPILLGLNNSAISFGTAAAGIIGAAGTELLGGRYLGYIGGSFVFASIIVSELFARNTRTALSRECIG